MVVTKAADRAAERPVTIVIIGAGVWGSALARLARQNQQAIVRLWSRRSAETLAEAIRGADFVLSAVSMKGVSDSIARLGLTNMPRSAVLITATKGLDAESHQTPSQLWHAAFPHNPIVVLSGPNLSQEIEHGLPAATVVASQDQAAAEAVQRVFASDVLRVYANLDPIGTELGGTLKNVMAIAAGVCDGLQLGTNAKAALLTRALPEMIRIGTHLGAQAETFFGLAGLGDLLATCNSALSRNYQVGYGLAQGKPLDRVLAEIHSTVEGVNTVEVLVEIAREQQILVPIARQVHRLLHGQITPQQAVRALIDRDLKQEFEDELL